MDVEAPRRLLRFFDEVEDPRMDRTKRHALSDILFITLCGVICGADSWIEIEVFGNAKLNWFRTLLELPNGIPSHDTFGRVFSQLNPRQLEQCFRKLILALAERSHHKLIAIDGKTIRRSFDKAGNKAAIHMISAWCDTNHLVLGQLATDAKSNEITAIPELLEMLDIRDSVITIDAIGCQTEIARKIVKQKGHYVLQVKKNQPNLHVAIQSLFDEWTTRGIDGVSCDYYEQVEKGHGRIKTRRIWTTTWTQWYADRKDWADLCSFSCVENRREINGIVSTERHYYISDLAADAATMLGHIRGHWGIENKLHWSLDVTFREDEQRHRMGHSAENMSRIRRLALNLLRQDKSVKVGAKAKRLKASLQHEYLLKIICGAF